MDQLLENDTRETSVWLDKWNSIKFLEYIYLDWLILPEDKTLEGLLDDLVSQGHYKRSSNHKKSGWTGYTKVKESNHRNCEAKLTTFFNDVHAAVYKACGISCL